MQRFWKKVNKSGNCWIWTAAVDKYGYGNFGFNGKVVKAHRMGWFLTFSHWPVLWLLHKCNNTKCVNPNHLYEGTPRQNTRDSINAGTCKLGYKTFDDFTRQEIKNK